MDFENLVDKTVEKGETSIDEVLETLEKVLDKAVDMTETGTDKIGDLAERISDKFSNSVFMHKLMVLQDRKGIWSGEEDILKKADISDLNRWYSSQQEMISIIEKIIANLKSVENPDKETKQVLEEYEATLEGCFADIGILGAEIDKRKNQS